jgi:hypothetical protein
MGGEALEAVVLDIVELGEVEGVDGDGAIVEAEPTLCRRRRACCSKSVFERCLAQRA